MRVNDLVLVRGMQDTELALRRWNRRPVRTLWPWVRLSLLISLGLLASVYLVAKLSTPDSTRYLIPGYNEPAALGDYLDVLFRNSLVLALHAMACVAGFIAGSSLPLSAAKRSGASRWVHEKAGPLAIGFVICATTFSLGTQAYILGSNLSTIANQLAITPATLLVCYLPHAVPELIALYLPLAAWLIASRKGDWDQLLAATFVTLAISIPLLIVSVTIETFVSPEILTAVLPR